MFLEILNVRGELMMIWGNYLLIASRPDGGPYYDDKDEIKRFNCWLCIDLMIVVYMKLWRGDQMKTLDVMNVGCTIF